MIVDDFLLAMIIAGLGFASAYLRAEYALHLRFKAAERTKELTLHDLHAARDHVGGAHKAVGGCRLPVEKTRAPARVLSIPYPPNQTSSQGW